MEIKTPTATLEGDNIEAILEEYGRRCLRGADLRGADLRGADLRGADMTGADLRGADLRGADMTGAYLRNANLHCADLRGARLRGACMTDAYMCRANLRGANLLAADLTGADLTGADLAGANLTLAKLTDAGNADIITARARILPDEGDIIGWKKARDIDGYPVIVKLLIPSDAQRSNSGGRKCRASKAKVLDMQDLNGNSLGPGAKAYSTHDVSFAYKVGETVEVENFDPDRWNECTTGIHFFITRLEARRY